MIAPACAKVHRSLPPEFRFFPLIDEKPTPGWPTNNLSADECQTLLEVKGIQHYGIVVPPSAIVVDVDPRNGGTAGLAKLESDLGVVLCDVCLLSVVTGGGGQHMYFAFDASIASIKELAAYPGVDFLRTQPPGSGGGRFVVGPGSSAMTGKMHLHGYSVDRDVGFGLSPCPAGLVELIRRQSRESKEAYPVVGGDPEELRRGIAAMAKMPAELAEIREDWVRIGHACKKVGEEMFEPWVEWSSKAEAFVSAEDCRYSWDGFQPSGEIGMATLIFLTGDQFKEPPSLMEMFGEVAELPDTFEQVPSPAVVADEVADAPPLELVKPRNKYLNYEIIGKGKEAKKVGLTLAELINPMLQVGWPKACQGNLFVPQGANDVRILATPSELISWIQSRAKVVWAAGPDKVLKSELFAGISQNCDQVNSIEISPHFPPVPATHYMTRIPPGRVEDLYKFVRMFLPDHELDFWLLVAAIVTPFWGGPRGGRPLMAITSVDHVGAGKTTLAEAIAWLTGLGDGSLHIVTCRADLRDLPRAMGSRAAKPGSKRIVLIDNFRGQALMGSEIESLITAKSISGWKLYVGDVDIPNNYCWFVTGNHVDMGEDMASRTVEVRIKKPPVVLDGGAWAAKLAQFDPQKVVAGIAAFFQLQAQPVAANRFGPWCSEVVGRLGNPEGVMDLIRTRGAELSLADDDAAEAIQAIESFLSSTGWKPENGRAHLSARDLAKFCFENRHLMGLQGRGMITPHAITRFLKTVQGQIESLKQCKDTAVRGFWWDPQGGRG